MKPSSDRLMLLQVGLVVLCACACGPSAAEIRHAETARYTLRRDRLWSEVMEVVKSRFPRIEVQSVDGRRLVTFWTPTGRRILETSDETSSLNGMSRAKGESTPELMRITVLVSGDSPYQVKIDVEAGIYMSPTRPPLVYQHNSAEEPIWVPSRNDDLALALYERLRQYSVAR